MADKEKLSPEDELKAKISELEAQVKASEDARIKAEEGLAKAEEGLKDGEKHVYSKNLGYTAVGAGNLAFADGHAITGDTRLLEWYKSHGYVVSDKRLTKEEVAERLNAKK